MRSITIVFFMASIWTFFSCKNKKKEVVETKTFQLHSRQDTVNKKVTQKIFEEVVEFNYSDFNNLKDNKFYDRFLAGKIKLPTGQIVCTDPMYRALALPQTWMVNKGEYPVYLYIGLEGDFAGRVAYAELVIKDEIPKYWEMSLIAEELLVDSFERMMNGMYPVENGLSSFSDFQTFKIFEQGIKEFYRLHKTGNYYNDVLEKKFQENRNIPKSSRGEDWINYQPMNSNGNMIMFASGYGDGIYPRYVGYDKDGKVVKFVTDFIQLNNKADL